MAELTKGTDFVVDHMVFCTIHGDEPIGFFCKQCQMLLCITCLLATHKSHDIVTIEKALDELLPSIQSHLKLADTLGDTIEMNVKAVENKEKELKVKYKQCKDMIQQNADQRIAVIINEKEKWMANLTEEEEKQVTMNLTENATTMKYFFAFEFKDRSIQGRVGYKHVSVFVFKYIPKHVFVSVFAIFKICVFVLVFVFDHCIKEYLIEYPNTDIISCVIHTLNVAPFN